MQMWNWITSKNWGLIKKIGAILENQSRAKAHNQAVSTKQYNDFTLFSEINEIYSITLTKIDLWFA